MKNDKPFDVIVIGAGAAGLMCAIQAGRRGRKVLVLERAEKIGKKIRISGGGRCNFTNLGVSAQNFISNNIHFCKSALARYTPQDFISLVEKHKIKYHEKKLGQLFCDDTSERIIQLLEQECKEAGVEVRVGQAVSRVAKAEGGGFQVQSGHDSLKCESLVIATGGLSIPKMGATAFGYEIAKSFGLKVVPCRPALVPLTWGPKDLRVYAELSGVSLDTVVSLGRQEFRENILFTHRGLSGPAILQISNYWKPGDPVFIDFLPDVDEEILLQELVDGRNRGRDLAELLSKRLPKRFCQIWCDQNLSAKVMSNRSARDLKGVIELLRRWRVEPAGTEGYEKAEVTAGGVDTEGISSKNMECNNVPGLYFVGEVLDVTGHLGGYNFQWAWASGFAAGQTA